MRSFRRNGKQAARGLRSRKVAPGEKRPGPRSPPCHPARPPQRRNETLKQMTTRKHGTRTPANEKSGSQDCRTRASAPKRRLSASRSRCGGLACLSEDRAGTLRQTGLRTRGAPRGKRRLCPTLPVTGCCLLRLHFKSQGCPSPPRVCSCGAHAGVGSHCPLARSLVQQAWLRPALRSHGDAGRVLSPLSEVYLRSWSAATAACVPCTSSSASVTCRYWVGASSGASVAG